MHILLGERIAECLVVIHQLKVPVGKQVEVELAKRKDNSEGLALSG